MNINITLIGQMITFAIFIWLTMRFIWPQLLSVLEERELKISNGLTAAIEAEEQLKLVAQQRLLQLEETKQHCAKLLQEAKRQAEEIIESATLQAREQREAILVAAQLEIDKQRLSLQQELKVHLAKLVMQGAESILREQLTPELHQKILDSSCRLYD